MTVGWMLRKKSCSIGCVVDSAVTIPWHLRVITADGAAPAGREMEIVDARDGEVATLGRFRVVCLPGAERERRPTEPKGADRGVARVVIAGRIEMRVAALNASEIGKVSGVLLLKGVIEHFPPGRQSEKSVGRSRRLGNAHVTSALPWALEVILAEKLSGKGYVIPWRRLRHLG